MFDIGGTELLVLAIVAIVVVGPKELPRMLRTVGRFVGKAKVMAREFQNHFNEAADDAGLSEMRKGISEATSGRGMGDALKPFTDAGDDLKRELEKTERAAPTTTPKAADGAGESGPAEAEAADKTPAPDPAPETADNDAKAASS